VAIGSEESTLNEDDADAIAALRAGNIAGLSALVQRYQLQALRLAFNVCGNRQTAEDTVADAFLAVQRHINAHDASRPFAPWFYRIVINSARSAVRREGKLAMVSDTELPMLEQPDCSPGPEVLAVQSERDGVLVHEIGRLPQKQREAVVLRYYLDMDERTMASVLGVPSGTVKWRLFQARATLRRRLSKGGEDVNRPLGEEGQRP
jgi:RNA polymerase sigma-70 factor (ECF subfamily)